MSISASAPELPLNLRAALWYGRRGLCIHPLRPDSKRPLSDEWQHRATTDPGAIAAWWLRRWPNAGVGIATGAESGLIVLDIDPRHGGADSLEALVAEHGELPETWSVQTPSGGTHYYFRHPGGRVGNRAGIRPGLDLRGDGGYVVAPPTELEGGRRYVWESGCAPHELELAGAPVWLLELIGGRGESGAATPPDEWARLVRYGAEIGTRNAAAARLAGYLLRRRPAPRVVLELIRAWNAARCRPPLDDEEIVRVVDSIAKREAARRRENG